MAGYYFEPMMQRYTLIICRHTRYLMSTDGRNEIAKAIKDCRKKYGKIQTKKFHYALIHAGAIYPQLSSKRPINIRELTDMNSLNMF